MEKVWITTTLMISFFTFPGYSYQIGKVQNYKETHFKFYHGQSNKPIQAKNGFQQKVTLKNGLYSVIRRFADLKSTYNLIVSDSTLETFIIKNSDISKSLITQSRQNTNSIYNRIKDQSKRTMVSDLGHLGIIRSKKTKDPRFSITIDLCPSRKNWDDDLFKSLLSLSAQRLRKNQTPLPVGIAITGRWIKQNPASFRKLKHWHLQGKLDITWINHSFSHPLRPNRFQIYEFMTAKNVSMEREIFRLEKMIIEQGLLPSVWFRFPGLAFNPQRLSQLNNLGLIPLGSNAWIAKGQKIKEGSVVLLHGNGNERPGVNGFLQYLKNNENDSALPTRVSSLQKLN